MHPTLHRKLFRDFLLVIGLLCLLTLSLAALAFHRTVIRDAQERTQTDLRAARRLLAAPAQNIQAILSTLAALPVETLDQLEAYQLQPLAQTYHLDLAGILNLSTHQGRRLLSSRPLTTSLTWLETPPVQAGTGFLLLPLSELEQENPPLAAQLLAQDPRFPPTTRHYHRDQLLASVAWVPIRDPRGTPIRLLYAGQVLNLDNARVDTIRDTLFQEESWNGKPLGTVTLFQGDVRVATNVLDASGQRALGTTVSPAVQRQVLQEGRRWTDRAFVVDAWYLATYEPLRDPAGKTVGMLYVGLLEGRYLSLRNRILASFLGVFAIGLGITVAVSWLLTRSLMAPVRRLLEGTQHLHQGRLDVTLEAGPHWPRELVTLTHGFNDMAQALHNRDISLQDVNNDLKRLNQQLEGLNRNYSEILGFISHEISNMVGVMLLDIHTLRDESWETLKPEDREVVGSLLSYVERLRDMIRNYLDLSRLERGRIQVQKRSIQLWEQVLEPVQRELSARFQSREQRLEVDELTRELRLEADPNLLRIVFYNLLHNAVKYGQTMGNIRIFLEQTPHQVRIHVWNEGQGIPPDELPLICQRFHRVVEGEPFTQQGSGLGLFITREIVERHGGQLEVTSKQGEWADFAVGLPYPA